MELPQRSGDDRFTKAGRYCELESQIRRRVGGQEAPVLLVCAFDPCTRLGPFVHFDRTMIPGAAVAVASALHAAGLTNVRVVLQAWNPRLRPSLARFDGKPPEMLMVSSMQIHSARAYRLIRDAWRLDDERPLILVGGPKATYEPWDFFGLSPDGTEEADVVVTGEEFVLLELLERILEHKGSGDSMRVAFERVRAAGLLDDIPGLVYRPDASKEAPEYLINTGIQRLVRDLDEMPVPFDSLALFERPHRRPTLSPSPLPVEKLRRYVGIVSVVTTRGCKFHCDYCPIPAYNQFTYRHRSPERIAEEIAGIAERTGIRGFFGTDDNFFNDRVLAERTLAAMARRTVTERPFREAIHFATEATERDVFKHRDLLSMARDAGLQSLWLGVEDLTATLVKKGQTPEKTKTVFRLLEKQGIAPMPMIIHHDGQPLWSSRGLYSLSRQVRFLRRAGALTCQINLLMPMVGSSSYEHLFRQGMVLRRVAGKQVEDCHYDGNHCVATNSPVPWQRQWNMLVAYMLFYNPVNLLGAMPKLDDLWAPRLAYQMMGMTDVAKSVYRARGWLWRMFVGPIERFTEPPTPKFPMRAPL